jgi:hypothetical protein
MFLQSYRAGKYYNYDRDGDKIAIDLILNSGMIGTTGIEVERVYVVGYLNCECINKTSSK